MCKYFDITYCCNPIHVSWRVEECDLENNSLWGWVDCPNFEQLDVKPVGERCQNCGSRPNGQAAEAKEIGTQVGEPLRPTRTSLHGGEKKEWKV